MTQSLEAVNAFDKAQGEVKRRRKKIQKFVDNLTWNEIVRAMFLGASVIDLAIKYGVSDKTIYKWRKHIIDGTIPDRYSLTQRTLEVVKRSKIHFREDGTMKPWQPNQSYLEKLQALKQSSESENQLALDVPPPVEEPLNSFEHLRSLRAIDAEKTLKKAEDAGINFRVAGEDILIEGPPPFAHDLIECIQVYKPEILKLLRERPMAIDNLLTNLSKNATDQALKEFSMLLQAPSGDRFVTEVNDAQLMMFLKGQGFTLFKISLDEI
jgi:transposase-like protein